MAVLQLTNIHYVLTHTATKKIIIIEIIKRIIINRIEISKKYR